MQSIELKQEKQDFRTKEAFKTLRTNIEFSGRKYQGYLHHQLYTERRQEQRIL